MPNQPRICVVGSCMIDLISRVPRLPALGETLVGHSFHLGYGGKGANQATAAAKLGARVSMVARVGHDVFGQGTLDNFRSLGIGTTHVLQDADRFSGVAPIFVDDRAENVIVIVPGANYGLTPEDVRAAREEIASADVLCCQLEIPVESTLEAFRVARSAGVTTILNPAPAAPLPDELLGLTDICVPNEVELEMLTGYSAGSLEEAGHAAETLLARGPGHVIVTLGSRGSLVVTSGSTQHVPAVPVDAVDPTGAGDEFIGALAVFLAEGASMADATMAAAAAAAISVTRIGTQVSFPDRQEVERLLAARSPV
ncbi:MAG: ribokinase [Chloroflexi bacterium]|nr:ribokinase [Chloroflexota bacterium]